MDPNVDTDNEKPESQEPEPPDWATHRRSAHVMCRTSLWGVAGFLGCAYFAWISYSHVVRGEYDWPHDPWTAATYIVWIVLLAGLTLDTHCARERIFFAVLVVNFLVGGGLTLWSVASTAEVRAARLFTGALWTLAALVSLTTVGRAEAVSNE
jgi:hypothetical protein